MTKLSRVFSVPTLRYGRPSAEERPCLHEVGLRVEVMAQCAPTSMAGLSQNLAALQQLVEPFLRDSWAHRLLIGKQDDAALRYARSAATSLPRSYVLLPFAFDAEPLSRYLLQRLGAQACYADAPPIGAVQVTLEPGSSYLAALGNEACRQTPTSVDAGVRQTTKYRLVAPSKKAFGQK